jgi:hypothetical protein
MLVVISVDRYQIHIVQLEEEDKLPVTESLTPSNTILPPLAESKVGPLIKVPLLPFPLLSYQIVDPLT